MNRKKAGIAAGVALAIAAILAPATWRTAKTVNTADGLLFLAWSDGIQCGWAPWSEDCYLVRAAAAEWLLTHFDWPYEQRANPMFPSSAPEPLVWQAVTARSVSGAEGSERALRLLSVFADKGESLETRVDGYSSLHAAVLFDDIEAVRLLIELGADPYARIRRPGREHHYLNAIEFGEMLYYRNLDSRSEELTSYLATFGNAP